MSEIVLDKTGPQAEGAGGPGVEAAPGPGNQDQRNPPPPEEAPQPAPPPIPPQPRYGQGPDQPLAQPYAQPPERPLGQPPAQPYGQPPAGGRPSAVQPRAFQEAAFDPEDAMSNRPVAALAYFSFCFLIPLFARPASPFVKAHVNQGILLFMATAVVWPILSAGMLIPVLNVAVAVLAALFGILFVAVAAHQLYYCLQGRFRPLPIIGRLGTF